jgi:hypothetical protein
MKTKQLSWWSRSDGETRYWARVRGNGRYVISLAGAGDIWNVDHRIQRGRMRRQLGFAYTVTDAKQIAQHDYDQTAR